MRLDYYPDTVHARLKKRQRQTWGVKSDFATPYDTEEIMQPSVSDTVEVPNRPSARAVRMVGRFVVRRIGLRLIPIVGWGLLAKDIYDLATD